MYSQVYLSTQRVCLAQNMIYIHITSRFRHAYAYSLPLDVTQLAIHTSIHHLPVRNTAMGHI